MHRLYFGTIFLNFLSLCPRLSFTVNNTDPRWAAIGEQVKLNVTSEENTTDIPRIKHELHIGGLFDLDSRNGVGALSAAMLAVEEINKDSRYLEDYQIVLHHQRSTEDELSAGTSVLYKVLYEYLHTEPKKLMLLGPFDNDLAKTVAAYAGLPEIGILQFSYGATDLELTTERDRYPLFFRTVPTEIVFNEPRLRFIQHFGWKDEIGLIYHASPYYSQISKDLAKSLQRNGTIIVANEGFTEDPAVAVKILKDKGAHIIVGTFHHSRAREVFCQAYLNGMYGVNYVWMVTSTPHVDATSDWWVPESSSKLACTGSQMEEALDHHFTFYYKNEINGTLVSGKTTDQFFHNYSQMTPPVFRSARAPFAYEAMWAIAATLERARPILKEWGMGLHDLGYGRRMISELFKEEAFQVQFIGPSGEVSFDEKGNRMCKIFIQQFRKSIGAQEVGVYKYNPPTLTLKGHADGNSTPEVLEYVHWPAGQPYKRKASTDSWLYIRLPLFISWALISGFLLVCCVLCYALLLVFRRHRVIYHSGFYLTQLLIVGCMFNLFSVVLFGLDGALVSFEELQWVCKARSWFLSLGYTLCLGSVLPRVLFAYKVVSWRPKTIKTVPWIWMHVAAVIMFVGDVILLITWQIVFEPRAVKVLREVARPGPYQERTLLIEQCVSNNEEAALALLLVPKGMLLLIGALAAWPARRLCLPLCNNTRNCALCLGIAALMCIIEAPIIMRVRQYPNPFYGVTGLIIMVLSAALLVIGVLPQIKRAQKCKKKALIAARECNDIEMTQDNSSGRCDCNVCADPKKFRPQLAACSGPHSCAPVPQDWDYMVGGVPNRTKEDEPHIVTERVYVDAPAVPTTAAHTQTVKVVSNTAEVQTVIVRTQSACMLTEPEPEVERAEVMMQTEADEPTPVADANIQTINVKLSDGHVQTEKTPLVDSQAQTVKPKISHSQVQTDDPPPPPDIMSEESDTASVASSSTSPRPERKARKSKLVNVRPRIDTNLSSKKKEILSKSSHVSKPRLRVEAPVPYNSRTEDYTPLSPRSRDPSPARGAKR